jgi:hypothetical protein
LGASVRGFKKGLDDDTSEEPVLVEAKAPDDAAVPRV